MKEKYIILIGSVLLIGIVFYLLSTNMIADKLDTISRIDRVIRRDQERLNSAKVMDEQLRQVSRVIENTLTDSRIFTADEINAMVRKFAELADKHEIAVYSSMPRAVHSSGHLIEHQFTMDIMATYVQLGRFLSEIEAMDYIIRLNTIDTKPIRGEDAGLMVDDEKVTQYRVILDLSAYKILKEEA